MADRDQGLWYNALAHFDAPYKPSPLATLKPGPEPTGSQRVQDSIYGWLGGRPENRATASALAGLFDVGTLGMATGAYDGAKDLAQTGRPSALAMALMPGAKVAGAGAQAATQAAKKGIRAFHGSPHDFDRFDLSKIGTGEGAQAYGHGLYFAENEAVAKGYRDALSKNQTRTALRDQKYNADGSPNFPAMGAEWMLTPGGGTPQEMLDDFARYAPDSTPAQRQQWLDEAKLLHDRAKMPGRMYEVNIKADPEDFLDWDKPLSQQPKVAGLVQTDDQGRLILPNGERAPPDKLRGESFYRAFAEARGGGTQPGSEALKEAGIPGIRYLDQGSRDAGEGSRNYVAFDDSLIEILRKYGLLPPAVAGGVAASQSDAQAGQ